MKGQEWIGGLFSLLLTGIIAGIALPAILPGQAIKVTPAVDANEFENKAIILADSLLSNPKLVYFDGNSFHRGVLDKEKLDSLKAGQSSIDLIYPDTFVYMSVIGEMEFWSFQTKDRESETINRFTECLGQNSTVEIEPMIDCAPNRFSNVMDKGFPVAIRYSDNEVHMGILSVTVIE